MMYHIEFFNSLGKRGEIEEYFQKVALPYLKDKGFEVYFLATQFGLGLREFCFVTAIEKFGSIDFWDDIARGETKGKEIMDNLESLMYDIKASIVKDLEPEIKWIRESEKMYHLENFNSRGSAEELEDFFIYTAFPYLRKRGFNIKLLKTQHELGPADYWFITEMDSFVSIDKWPEMAAGEPEGEKIMSRLLEIIDIPKATIIKEIPAINSKTFKNT